MPQVIAEVANQSQLIEQLNAKIHELSSRPATAAAAPEPAPSPIKFPDPGQFDGTKIYAYPQWKQKVLAKLRADADRLGTTTQQVWYIFSMLGSPAADRAEPWITAQPSPTPDSLLQHLDS